MGGAATTTNPTYSVLFRGEGVNNQASGSLSGATVVTAVSAPGSGRRLVDSLHVYNGDTVEQAITVARTGVTQFIRTLQPGDLLTWSDESGPQVIAASSLSGIGSAGTGTTASEQGNAVVHKTVLTMGDVSVTVGNTTGVSFGGTKIYDFPDGRILVLGAVATDISFDLTDAGNVTPIDDTMGGDIAVGTTAPDDGSLTGTDVDLIPSTSIDPISGGVTGSPLASSAQFDGTGTAKDAFFNILIDDADVADGASDVILVSGTVTIHWINLGNY
jgi:hypothetical protein